MLDGRSLIDSELYSYVALSIHETEFPAVGQVQPFQVSIAVRESCHLPCFDFALFFVAVHRRRGCGHTTRHKPLRSVRPSLSNRNSCNGTCPVRRPSSAQR